MKLSNAIAECINYHKANSRESTIKNYTLTLCPFDTHFKNRDVKSVDSNEIHRFLEFITSKCNQNTKNLRFRLLKAFFNFCINILNLDLKNPCNTMLLNKTYHPSRPGARTIINKDLLDEIIYKITSKRDRLLLEIQARSGLRIGEVLKLCPKDINGRKITIESPKSGKESEFAFLSTPVAERLNSYIIQNQVQSDQRIFNFTYCTALNIVRRAGRLLSIKLRPHDLRRYSATYASRSGIPLEIVSKVILRHQDLRTTQIYLGKITDDEALRWIDSLHNK